MNRIGIILEEKGIKQSWLCEQIGKSYNMVNGYVCNRRQPKMEVLFSIADCLNVNPSQLIDDRYFERQKMLRKLLIN